MKNIQNQKTYDYRIADVDYTGDKTYYSKIITGIRSGETLPVLFELKQNYPNPFNPVTTISYSLPKEAQTKLTIYSLTGELIVTLVDANQPSGIHRLIWNGKEQNGYSVGSGIYLLKLEADMYTQTRKIVFLK